MNKKKNSKKSDTIKDPFEIVWESAIEAVASYFEEGDEQNLESSFEKSLRFGLKIISSSEIFKGYSESSKARIKDVFVKTIRLRMLDSAELTDNGIIFHQTIGKFVMQNSLEINDIAKLIQTHLQDVYPDLTILTIKTCIVSYAQKLNSAKKSAMEKKNRLLDILESDELI